MIVKLTDEQRQALLESPGDPVPVEDEESHKVYYLVERDQLTRLVDERLRRELQAGFDDADRGRVVPWEPEKLKAEGRAWLQERSGQT